MIIYFSGTGNSRYCAEFLADRLGDTAINSFEAIKSKTGITAESERPWIFVSPTYGWRIPKIFEECLRSSRLSGSRAAYFIMTAGSEIGDAEQLNSRLCSEIGLDFMGTQPVIMPENYIALFGTPPPAEADKIISAARPSLERAAELIARGAAIPKNKSGAIDRMKSGFVNRVFYRCIIKAKRFRTTEACTGCGACAAGCVLGNIELTGGRPIFGDRCTHCMACIRLPV